MIQEVRTIDKAIIDQIRCTGAIHSITITEDCEGFETCVLKDQDCGDMCIIQSIGGEISITHIDTNEVDALKAMLC
jgi:hypothetical protein